MDLQYFFFQEATSGFVIHKAAGILKTNEFRDVKIGVK